MNLIAPAVIVALVAKAASDFRPIAQKARPWRKTIRELGAVYGVSEHILIGLIARESMFNPGAIGSAGEVGLTQFKPIAAQDVGINFEQLKADPRLQIEAACRLLKKNYDRLGGDLIGSLRAYNRGIGAAQKDSGAGTEYAMDVLKNAALDWLNSAFGMGDMV